MDVITDRWILDGLRRVDRAGRGHCRYQTDANSVPVGSILRKVLARNGYRYEPKPQQELSYERIA